MDAERVLTSVAQILRAGGERRVTALRVAESIRSLGGFRWVGLYDVLDREIAVIAWSGPSAPAHPRFARDQGLTGAAVRDGVPVVVQDVTADSRYLTTLSGTRAEAIFPVRRVEDGAIVGTLDVESDRVNAFSDDDRGILESCAHAIAPLWRTA